MLLVCIFINYHSYHLLNKEYFGRALLKGMLTNFPEIEEIILVFSSIQSLFSTGRLHTFEVKVCVF